ncbi:MAG: RlmE family RNA methyltransferase [Gammaproteobacteria bacterium]|nr:RlmE family RNA methyltransferase [Gammaproteobacteria bacterium]
MARKSKSSSRWLSRQRRDPYAGRAVSRALFKLEQLDRRFHLTGPDRVVLELGASPGGWTEYLAPRCRRLVAVDLLPLANTPSGTRFIQGDAGDADVQEQIAVALSGGADLVLSDMAPNMSGNRVVDQARSLELVECAIHAAGRWLNPGGRLVVKMFQGAGFTDAMRDMRAGFARVSLAKPPASRAGSREVYAVADME